MNTNCARATNRAMSTRGRPKPTDEEAEALRKITWEMIREDFAGTQSDAAAALGITKSSLNDFLNGRNNGGLGVQRALAGYLRQPIENVLAAGNLTKLRAGKIKSTEVVFGKLPLWPELLAGARSIDPSVPEWCWTMVAEATVWIHKPVTSAMVCDLARFFRAHFQPPAMR